MTLPRMDNLPPLLDRAHVYTHDEIRDEYLATIQRAVSHSGQTRARQEMLGPSEIGSPCDRRLGFRLLGMPPVNAERDRISWRAAVGTIVHEWLSNVLDDMNYERSIQGAPARYFPEMHVDVGEIGSKPIIGTCDSYDRMYAGVVDWKVPLYPATTPTPS